MPFDALSQGPAAPSAPLLTLIPAGAPADGPDAEVAGLRRLGWPVMTLPATGVADGAPWLGAGRPLPLLRAARQALAQRQLPATVALRRGAAIAQAFRAGGCGAIHATAADAAAAVVAARLAGVPVSLMVREADLAIPGLAPALRAAGLLLAEDPAVAAALRALAPRACLHVLAPAIEADRLLEAEAASRNDRLLCLAPMEAASDLSLLLAALACLPPDRRPVIDLIGRGPLLDILRAEALELGVTDHARFLGARDDGWLAAEGPRYLGLVSAAAAAEPVLRGMALALPVVAPALPALREVVPPEAGHLASPGDPAALARGLRWLGAMAEDQRRLLGQAGRDRVMGRHTMATRAASLAQALERSLAQAAA
jgi:glycosyltransferase involved in cell wall biosynthesis